MFLSWASRHVRKSAAHSVTQRPRRRIPLSLELCEERLLPGQLLSFLLDPIAAVFGPAPVEQPEPSLGEDTLATTPCLMTEAAGSSVIHQSFPPLPAAVEGQARTNDLLAAPFVTRPAGVLEAANALTAEFNGATRLQDSWSTPGRSWGSNDFRSVQVNVNAQGYNILGDAANEPSMAVDPTNPNRIVIGWRQFDTWTSNFRQAGWAYSHNAGRTWTFPGVIEPGVFRSDPVLEVDGDGNFYYNSLSTNPYTATVYKSTNGGVSWDNGTFAYGGDKQWMVIDRTNGPGRGNIYEDWNRQYTTYGGDFTRSTNNGVSYTQPINLPGNPIWGTLAVGPQSELYLSGRIGNNFVVVRSANAYNPDVTPTFASTTVSLGGAPAPTGGAPNPGGLLGQAWIATDHSSGPSRGNVYLLSPVDPTGPDPLDVMIARSTNGGASFDPPVRVNDDTQVAGAWQWMAAMSVAPNGRIDVIWVDTRSTLQPNMGRLYYSYSVDDGATWSRNIAVSPVFNSHVGWPNQNKIGDYYQSVSDNTGMNVAYAATFNGEQDVYFLRINVEQVSHVIPATPLERPQWP